MVVVRRQTKLVGDSCQLMVVLRPVAGFTTTMI
jgi:hypothetical protein